MSITTNSKLSVSSYEYQILKRVTDIALSLLAIILLSPVLVVTGLLVKLTSEGPLLFKQKRVGSGVFTLYKFRSMKVDAEDEKKSLLHLNERDGPVFKIANDPRVTPIGRFIRKYALDELPQLYNILIGDMSFVGPRPATTGEVAKYTPYHSRRLEAKPGLTCTWQISPNKDDISFDEWVAMDIAYIENRNYIGDINLILQTIPYIVLGDHKA